MKVLVTGAKGFIGRNLTAHLANRNDVVILAYDIENTLDELNNWLAQADFVYHLAGVNRPQKEEEFFTGNAGLTSYICDHLAAREDPPPLLLSSSIQAELDNPYGRSKRMAEEAVTHYGRQTGARAIVYRLTNVFGKWSRPNYNTVVATFCYNIAHDLPITISDPQREVELIHIDDVVRTFLSELDGNDLTDNVYEPGVAIFKQVSPSYPVALGRLANLIRSFRGSRQSLLMPDFSDPFIYKLYGMYLTYLDETAFAYDLTQRSDERGALAEFMKSPHFGQIFVSRTRPGVTRGNHFHHTKAEKFLVLEGDAIIRFRPLHRDGEVIEYRVSGKDFRVLDIPPGYTHNIENVGNTDLITLFWASEIFDPERPDTYYEIV